MIPDQVDDGLMSAGSTRTATCLTSIDPTSTSTVTTSTLRALVRAARPRQWIKNVLVTAGPLAASSILQPDILRAVCVAFVAFCLVSSGIYLVNDTFDREADRAHPIKRLRPIASGAVSLRLATTTGIALLVAGHTLALLFGYTTLAIVLGIYTTLQLAYCTLLKHEPVIDLAIVSSGFLLRAIAGGAAAQVPLSMWFLLVASFGSLFMVAGKRFSEVVLMGEGKNVTRKNLEEYSANYLRFVWGMAATATITFYSLWAFSLVRENDFLPQLSIAPFVLALLRYAIDIDKGAAGEPETIAFGDRGLRIIGALWLVVFIASATVG